MAAITVTFNLPERFLDLPGQRYGFVLLAAFLISFLFIRTSARLMRSPRVSWWPGSVETSSGIHLHHLVWGIGLLLVAGFLSFVSQPVSPWHDILAGLFGVGAGLTLDEFALWVHLRDVYWAEEGRSSVDAVVVAALLGGLIVLGFAPFDLSHQGSSVASLAVTVLIDLSLSLVAIGKGRLLLGLVGVFFPPASIIALARLAAPGSPWARRFYRPGSRRHKRATERWVRIEARRRRLSDLVAGRPTEGL
jgi:hypothetical protein